MKIVVTGAAGFIGVHTAATLLSRGDRVIGLDNLSRKGAAENVAWLTAKGGDFRFCHADIRNQHDVESLLASERDINAVIHLAGQVAVTTSVANPRMDFEANALGTLNVLEGVRSHCPDAAVLYASTNKVYGGMDGIPVEERNNRYGFRDQPAGIEESATLDFHSPYGCSKGAADQYVRDYYRLYGIKTVVLRQSCIYGTRQFGVEDQGWVSWFTIARLLDKPITIYGDGKQIRDILWIDDLVTLYLSAIERIDVAAGNVYNAGGGPGNTLSILELMDYLTELTGKRAMPSTADWRPGDQKVFVANIEKASKQLGWRPTVSPAEGIEKLFNWTAESKDLLAAMFARK